MRTGGIAERLSERIEKMMNQTKKHTTSKKLLALLLAVIMSLSLLPVSVLAAGLDGEPEDAPQVTAPVEQQEDDAAPTDETDVVPAALDEAEEVQARDTSKDGFIRIFHLDCGRKYFTADEINGIIDKLAENHYTHIQLAFGNNGFRFLLDDMSVVANGTTYSDTAVRAAVIAGNSQYSTSKSTSTSTLSESDMDSIIAHAKDKGISVIPLLNTPGHMDALVSAMQQLGLRSSTGSEMSLTSEKELGFIKALQQKYITYFAANGSDHYNFAADEYSFDKLDNNGYTAFAQYVNDTAAMIKAAGMTPMAYNDGINYSGKTTSVPFDTDIQICYWAQATNYASVQDLAKAGFTIINNNDAWYYVLGDYLYSIWADGQWGYADALNGIQTTPVTQAKNAADGEILVAGSVLCCWCDGPSIDYYAKGKKATQQTNQESVYSLIEAMATNNPAYFKGTASEQVELPPASDGNGVSVVVKGQTGQTATVTVEPQASRTEGLPEGAEEAVTYNVSPSVEGAPYTGAGKVTLPIPEAWKNSTDRIRGYIVTDGVVELLTGAYVDGEYTFAVPHFSEMGLLLLAENAGTVNETIRLTIGGTRTVTIEGSFDGPYNPDPAGIATVTVNAQDATTGTVDYKETSMSYSALAGSNTSWTKTNYFHKVGDNYYPVYAYKVTETFIIWPTTYYVGYSTDGGAPTEANIANKKENAPITVYEKNVTAGTPASTTITFTGVAKGTTEVTIGNTHYTINVVEEDLTDAATLPIQLWITNVSIEVTGVTTKSSGQFNDYNNGGYAQYVTAKAEDAYGEDGVPLSELVPPAVKNNAETNIDDADATYSIWKGVVLNTTTGLQKYWWTDMTMASGRTDYQYVRYFGGAWAVSADRVDWTIVTGEGSTGASSSCKEQVIAYYMQRTNVTKEVITDVVDWGNTTDKWAENAPKQYAVLDFAVQYPDQRIPNSFPVDGKTVYFHCNEDDKTGAVHQDNDSNYYRRIGMIKGIDTTNYEVYMITVTPTSDTVTVQLTNSSTALTTSTTIEYKGTEKVAWVDDEANLPANFRSDAAKFHSISGTFNYTVGGAANLQGLEIYQRQGMLVTYYLRAKVNKDTLHVHYIDKTANVEFHNYDINVNEGTFFDENIGLNKTTADSWKGPLVNGTVPNDQKPPVNQTVSADLSTMPAIGAQYRFGNYKCEEVMRSEDGKEVFLYYTFVAEKTFVVDFGLPLNIKPTDVSAELEKANITAVQFDKSYYATITKGENFSINYTLNKTIDGVDNFQIVYKGTNLDTEQDGTATFTITVIPATNVYYEDSFATFYDAGSADAKTAFDVSTGADKMGQWYVEGTEQTAEQALEVLGEKKNVYGYDEAYKNSTTFSMGSAKKVTVNANTYKENNSSWPTATFTFKGTGFDIISLTDNKSGAIYVDVYKGNSIAGQRVSGYVVNNYYGYTYSETNGWQTTTAGGDNAIYQVPVIKVSDLAYDQYTVKIMVGYSQYQDVAKKGSYSFWLDAIRVYNPGGSALDNAYNLDREKNPDFVELRKVLLDANSFGTAGTANGAVFIDGKGEKATVEDYKNYGPNHEVYLASGQAIAFQLVASAELTDLQLGAKLANGTSAELTITGAKIKNADKLALGTATDMFYQLSDIGWTQSGNQYRSGVITLTNSGTDMISLTNLKFIGAEYVNDASKMDEAQDDRAMVAMVMDFDAAELAVAAVDSVLHPQEAQTFTPDRFEASWNRSSVKAGQRATLTVKTSVDVEAITVDGVTIDTYRTRTQRTGWGWNAKKVTYREFTYTITASETADHEIVAVNAEGTASEAITATLTVRAAAQRPGIGGWLNKLFSRWF